MLSDILSDIDGIKLFTLYENEKVIAPEEALPNSVFIFDDIISENQKIARTYFSSARHNLIDVCYLAQSYSKVPKQILLDNANFIVLFKKDETNLKHVYMEHCSGDMSYSEFKEFCTSFMAANGEVLGELITAKENIKCKYVALKHGKADIHSLVSETLSPIIEPLKQHFNLSSSFQTPEPNTIENKKDNSIEDSSKINDWFKSYDIDKTYGPKIRANGSVHLGKKEINHVDNTLTIEDISYPLTQGLSMTPVQANANPISVEIKQRKIINGKIKFNIGDNVRVSTYKGVFTKGCLPSWSTEIFKIVKINNTLPTTYQLQDYTGKPIAGCFYSEEILKTNYPNNYLVEKIIHRKGNQIFENGWGSIIHTIVG
ncbi:hypothetical protein QTP88_020127 [Uroleucon formosanum]